MFTVTLNYNCNYGFVTYDEEKKIAKVTLPVAEAKAAVEKFLKESITLDAPQGETIRDFVTKKLQPLANKESFQEALTRLWGKTGVRVEWSMPPGVVEHL